MQISDIVALVANISLAVSVLVAVIFGMAQVRAAARDRKERLTLETLRLFQTREFTELIVYIISGNFPKTREEMNALSTQDRVMFTDFAQRMEMLGILVAENMIDLDLVDKTLGDFVISAWKKYKPIFMELRQRAPDPYLGEYFQWLTIKMDRSFKDDDHRRPVYEELKPKQ